MQWTEVFEQGQETIFSSLKVGDIFAIKDTKVINKYWKSKVNDYIPYESPIIAKKISEKALQQLTSELPMPPHRVDEEKAKSVVVIVVRFRG